MKVHIVQPNETLTAIAAQYDTTFDQLLKYNPGLHIQNALDVGQKVKVPSSGVRVAKNESQPINRIEEQTPMPKWWYEEVEDQGSKAQVYANAIEPGPPLQELPQYPYAYYPAAYPSNLEQLPQAYDGSVYGAYAHMPAMPVGYGVLSPTPWYNQAMAILASNRIPIPPRVVNINGFRSLRMPDAFFRLDEWNEDWTEEENREDQA